MLVFSSYPNANLQIKNLGPVTENVTILDEDNYEMSGDNAQVEIGHESSGPRVNPELSMYPTGIFIIRF